MAGGNVTLQGAGNKQYGIHYDTRVNYLTGRILAHQINAGIDDGKIRTVPEGTAPKLPKHTTGEYIQTQDRATVLPAGYDAVGDLAGNATISGSGDKHESILAGGGNLDFIAHAGAGTIAGGGGNDLIQLGPKTHNWLVALGNGNDTIQASSSAGRMTIDAGLGNDFISLGSGKSHVHVEGAATIHGGSGPLTLYGGQRGLDFVGGSGDAVVVGAKSGDNVFHAGSGNETLIGASDQPHHEHRGYDRDDRDRDDRPRDDRWHHRDHHHNQNLGMGSDAFVFLKGHAGGDDLIKNFRVGDKVVLAGYGSDEITKALASAHQTARGVQITLSDQTSITFKDMASLDPKSFILR